MDIIKAGKDSYTVKTKRGSLKAVLGERVEIVGAGRKDGFEITQPGEYEVEGISVFTYNSAERLAAVIQAEGVTVLCADRVLADSIIEEMDTVEVAIVAVTSETSKAMVEMIGKIEPSYVIPAGEEGEIQIFLKDFERTAREAPKLSLAKTAVTMDTTEVVVLSN